MSPATAASGATGAGATAAGADNGGVATGAASVVATGALVGLDEIAAATVPGGADVPIAFVTEEPHEDKTTTSANATRPTPTSFDCGVSEKPSFGVSFHTRASLHPRH